MADFQFKQLGWDGHDGFWTAGTGMGLSYAITEYAGMDKPFQAEARGSFMKVETFETWDEARAYVQADFERRAKTLFEPTTP